eukprot:Trichotokara_eunicae@DN2933_c0_g1_i1.p1
MVDMFLQAEGLQADEKRIDGPMKWMYDEEDQFDSFDYYSTSGCINCGGEYVFRAHHLPLKVLRCEHCGHTPARIHRDGESETLVDRLESNGSEGDGGVYIRGIRSSYNFGQNAKEWWQSRYVPSALSSANVEKRMNTISMMSKLKAPTIQELCEICGNDTAYYHSFQARSADEGMTIRYECTQCHNRKTFNN